MERPASACPFLYRPMVAATLGVGAGIVFFETLTCTGHLWALCLFSIIGLFCWYLGLLPQRTFAIALVLSLLRCLLLPAFSLPSWFLRPFEAARESLLAITRNLFQEPDASLLCAMLWGGRGGLDKTLYAAYKGAGVAHILSLSGLHVTFIVMLLNRFAGKTHISFRLSVTAGLMFAYCAIAAFPASLVRSALMCLCPLFAEALGRKKDQANSIAFAALCILLFSPASLFDIGFQLSFGAVAAIALLYQPLAAALPLPTKISADIAMSICGTLGTLPLTAYHFKEVALLSIFANLLILPIVPFAFFASMATCFAGAVYSRLGELLAPTARMFVRGMSAGAQAVSALPFALIETQKPSILSCVFFFGALLMLSRYCLWPNSKKYASGAALFAASLVAML